MKILVIGGTGVLGHNIVNSLKVEHDVNWTFLKNVSTLKGGEFLDITDKESSELLIKKFCPDVIINAAAYTSMDLCERNKEIAYQINVTGLENIISGAKISGSKLIQISTSAVFDGKKSIYYENDETSPISHYGYTKSMSENILKISDIPYLIIRTDQPYCWIEKWQHTNSVIRTIQTLKNRIQLNEITDWFNTPTYVPEFVNAMKILISQDISGIIHVTGSDYMNRYEFSMIVADVFNLDKKLINPISSNTLKLPAKRANVRLSNKMLIEKIGIKMNDVNENLYLMLKDHLNFKKV